MSLGRVSFSQTPLRAVSSTIFILATLFASHSQAAKWYQIEMIVFEHQLPITSVRDPLPENYIVPISTTAKNLSYDGDSSVRRGGSVGFKVLSKGLHFMGHHYNQLASSRDYNPIYHVAWRQPVQQSTTGYKIQIKAGQIYSNNQPAPAPTPTDPGGSENSEQPAVPNNPATPAVNTGGKSLHALTGTIEVTLGRYLHFDADLFYRKPGKNAGETDASLKMYRLKHKRRMKSKEVHYIDNPMFGVLVYIKPL